MSSSQEPCKKKRIHSNCRTSQKINRVNQQTKDLQTIMQILDKCEQNKPKETITFLDLSLELCCDVDNVLNNLNSAVGTKDTVVPQISRETEEQFLHEADSVEEQCIMKESCECMHLDSNEKFIGTQLVLPELDVNTDGLCVLCLRKRTQLLFYSILHQGRKSTAIIQKYGNFCGVNNEYHPQAMLIMPPSGPVHVMPLPIVAHQRNRYHVINTNGKRRIQQVGVSMSDFGNASEPTQKLPTSK